MCRHWNDDDDNNRVLDDGDGFSICEQFTLMRFMVENVSAGPNLHRARRFIVEFPEASSRLLAILKNAAVGHLVEQIAAGAQVSEHEFV